MMDSKTITYDIDGYKIISDALKDLLNKYPGLSEGDEITFSGLLKDGGKSFYPITGAVVETTRTGVTGHVRQICRYPFHIYYSVPANLSEEAKITVKEWLDELGRWLEGHAIAIGDVEYQLTEYPKLTENRKILSIERQTPAFANDPMDNQMQAWEIYISARYQYEFDKKYF